MVKQNIITKLKRFYDIEQQLAYFIRLHLLKITFYELDLIKSVLAGHQVVEILKKILKKYEVVVSIIVY